MTLTIKTFGLTLATALVCGAIGFAATQDSSTDPTGVAEVPGVSGHHHGFWSRRAQRIERSEPRIERSEPRVERREFLRSLQITDAQRAQALEDARGVRPNVEAARTEARKIIADARAANPSGDRAAIRDAVRPQLEVLREHARAQIEPDARALVATLTPEQRQRLQDRAKARGVTFDENRFAARICRMLARPRAVEFLERRQAR